MRILHYFFGYNRSGGLNRYAVDLAAAQQENGDEVFVLFPGGSFLPRKKASVRRVKDHDGIHVYELCGGAPVPLLSGIRDPGMILNQKNRLPEKDLTVFCQEVAPDAIHIHTWMGFPFELLPELKKRNCRIVYTTHDYFGICPKVNFINEKRCLCLSPSDPACSACNANAPSEKFLRLQNYPPLFLMKKYLHGLVSYIRKRKGSSHEVGNTIPREKDYSGLASFYKNWFLYCDQIHFNSAVTQSVYRKHIPELAGKVIPITHRFIKDRRKYRENLNRTSVRMGFIGSSDPYKGLPMFLDILKEISGEGFLNWELGIWGTAGKPQEAESPRISYHGFFTADNMAEVFQNIDIAVVPSICFETFGFIVLEALSFGTPVLCSDTVGAQCLISPDMVFHGKEGLKQNILRILKDPELLNRERHKICSPNFHILTMDEHAKEIEQLYHG